MNRSLLLHRYAVATAAATFLLLIAGGLVTSTDSGLAVPDWPLSYGTWMPPMVGGILYEHGHRMIAATVGLMILVLAVWLGWVERRRWVRYLGYSALAGVVFQGMLGGMTVLFLLPAPVSIAHACLGPTVFCLIWCLAGVTAPSWRDAPRAVEDRRTPSLQRLTAGVAIMAAMQLLLGAVLRHTGDGVGWHVVGAIALAASAVWMLRRAQTAADAPAALRSGMARVAALILAQLGLGIAAWRDSQHAIVVTGHVVLGALILAQAVWLVWQARRHTIAVCQVPLRAYLELTKPRVTALVVVTAGVGFGLAMTSATPFALLVSVLFGTALTAGGANALNQWSERQYDALMERTSRRPIPSGRMSGELARRVGWALCVGGVVFLAAQVNLVAAGLAAASAVTYLCVYTPLKRRTSLCTLAGAIPGALPPLIGWAGARARLDAEAWWLFAILFLWQLPHFLAIAVLYREDYQRAGFRMLPVTEPDGITTARHIFLYGLVLVPVSLMPALSGMATEWYFVAAFLASAAFLAVGSRAALVRSLPSMRRLFLASVLYLPLLMGCLALDRWYLG